MEHDPHEGTSDVGASDGTPDTPATPAGPGDDPLLVIRAQLDEVEQLPLTERADVFERTHRIVVDELRALELG